MPYRLPPLHTMRLFEAAGRLLSFKLAAAELHVTPSALSHAIQSLEDWLGVQLFIRGNRSLALTKAGADYLPQVREALDLLARASAGLPGQAASGRLAVSVAPSFGLHWLMPHLPRFQARHPEIEIAVDTHHRQVDFPRDGVDLAIRMGSGGWQGLTAIRLVQERLVPVCAPGLAKTMARPADLSAATLLRVADVSEDWDSWFARAGLALPAGTRSLSFDTIHMALEAAARGLGVAMGRLPLAAGDLASGRLVAIFGPPRFCDTSYWLVAPAAALRRPAVKAFRHWIEAELNAASERNEAPDDAAPARGAPVSRFPSRIRNVAD
ncbi:MAG TPA: transcriptional regulator GcvA [Terriglobia bacterium]|nr:transcriptional regulator GcvA [Terriglobia bacterium]